MTIIIEASGPCQKRLWKHTSKLIYRAGWLWFAIAWLRVPFDEFCEAPKTWEFIDE